MFVSCNVFVHRRGLHRTLIAGIAQSPSFLILGALCGRNNAMSDGKTSTHDIEGPRHLRRPVPFVGCAGWSIPMGSSARFPSAGSHLERYAQVFDAVEVNSSFYRNHLPQTYRRWASAVPEDFRFSVKMPRDISHHHRLRDCDELLADFLGGVAELEQKLGFLLLQLPPSLDWDPGVVLPFLDQLHGRLDAPIACEPRHRSWFRPEVDRELSSRGVARVAADPAIGKRARVPSGSHQFEYIRLHGSPRVYYDSYTDDKLQRAARRLQRPSAITRQRWCIFDNTASGCATANALTLMNELRSR
jgi:uncharacterized protein YecE (DUF72 family)